MNPGIGEHIITKVKEITKELLVTNSSLIKNIINSDHIPFVYVYENKIGPTKAILYENGYNLENILQYIKRYNVEMNVQDLLDVYNNVDHKKEIFVTSFVIKILNSKTYCYTHTLVIPYPNGI